MISAAIRVVTVLTTTVMMALPGNPLGRVTLTAGPKVPVVVQRGAYVIVPGSKQIRLAVSRDYGACESFLSLSRDGRWLAVTTPAGALRLIDLRTRRSYSLGHGCDPTWGPDNRLAYLRATSVSLEQAAYRSTIVVRRTPLASGAVWASGQLWGLAWAGERLVYNRTRTTFPRRELLLASGPTSRRSAVTTTGNNDPLLVAASPDGRRLLVQVDRSVTIGGGTVVHTYQALVATATGKVLSEVSLSPSVGLTSGVWTGSDVVAPLGYADGGSSHPQPALTRLSTAGDALRVATARNLDPTSDGLGDWLAEVRATGHGTIAVTHHRLTSTLLSCRVSTLVCTTVLNLG